VLLAAKQARSDFDRLLASPAHAGSSLAAGGLRFLALHAAVISREPVRKAMRERRATIDAGLFVQPAQARRDRGRLEPERGRDLLVHVEPADHSDRGSPYASDDYREELERFGVVASMSRKGDCWDNAVAESFFSTLKTELVGDRIYASHDAATAAIAEYVDTFYNTIRRHSHLGYLSPIAFELRRQIEAKAA